MPEGKSKARRSLERIRRHRDSEDERPRRDLNVRGEVGWDYDAGPEREPVKPAVEGSALPAQVLSLFAEPGVTTITAVSAARALERPRAEIENAIEALVQAGELRPVADSSLRFAIPPERKAQLEAMFREAAHELGETTALALREPDELLAYDDDEEPRLPVTAGLLSLFLPGTGQLLNGDVGRASLVFAVWSLALLTHLSPIWTFVALYAGAEAFFTAKVRGMERRLALEAATAPKKELPSGTS